MMCKADAELPGIAALMAEAGIRRVLVVQDGKLLGTNHGWALLNTLSHFPDRSTRGILKSVAGLS